MSLHDRILVTSFRVRDTVMVQVSYRFETKKFHCNSRNRVVFGFVEQEVSCTWSLSKFPSMADRRRGVVTISSSQENIRVSSVEYKFVFD